MTDRPADAMLRAIVAGRPLRRGPRQDAESAILVLARPARRSLEYSVMASALTLLFPVVVLLAAVLAGASVRQGCRRGWGALAAATWCFLLGVAVRRFIGLGIVP